MESKMELIVLGLVATLVGVLSELIELFVDRIDTAYAAPAEQRYRARPATSVVEPRTAATLTTPMLRPSQDDQTRGATAAPGASAAGSRHDPLHA
jgi:hypothetical protein